MSEQTDTPAGDSTECGSRDPRLTVLHVDDDPDFADLVSTFLERADARIRVLTEHGVDAGLDRLGAATVDCVVSDYQMPGKDGLDFLEAVRAERGDLPFILFTGKGSEEIASDAVSSGVTDYLQKGRGTDQYELLANRIRNSVSRYRAERDLEARVEQQSVVAFLGQVALEGGDLGDLFDAAVERVAEQLAVEFVKVLEIEPDGESLALRAGVGWDEGLAGSATVGTGDQSQAGHTLSTSDPVVVEDLDAEDRFVGPALLTDHDVRSGVSVIIGARDDPWGVFGAHTGTVRRFTDEEVTFVQNVANVLAEAIERDAAEARLREGEERFRQIVEASPDVIFQVDTDGRVTYVSPAVEDETGYPPDRVEGRHFGATIAESSQPDARAAFERVMAGEAVEGLRLETVRRDGETRWVDVNAVPLDANGEVEGMLGFSRDVTEDVAHERELREREERFRAVFEAALDPMLIADDDGIYVDANPAACELFGRDREALLGRSIEEFLAPDVDFESEWETFERTGGARGRIPLVLDDGTRRVVEHASTHDIVPGRHLAILRDVTEE